MLKRLINLPRRGAAKGSTRLANPLLVLLLAVSLLPVPATADQELYDVEIIVFRHLDSGGLRSGERWPRTVPANVHDRYAELQSNVTPGPEVFLRLGDNSLNLRDTARRLQQDSGYEVITHIAWRQPGLSEQDSVAVAFPLGSQPPRADGDRDTVVNGMRSEDDETRAMAFLRPPTGLSGQIRIARERFLHADVDLRYVEEGRSRRGESRQAALSQFDDFPPVILMQERRRMRSDQLHYLDHPVLGVLIRITRADG